MFQEFRPYKYTSYMDLVHLVCEQCRVFGHMRPLGGKKSNSHSQLALDINHGEFIHIPYSYTNP
jgi:hypothetical protein